MRKAILVIPLVQLLMYIAIGLNISVLRQVIVFTYLSLIPGFVLLKILRLKELNVVDTTLFSVGLSISFLMFIGLLINELYPIIGVPQPLSTVPLTITLSLLTLVLFFIGYRQDFSEILNLSGWRDIRLEDIRRSLIFVFPPLLAIIGALYNYTPALLLMIILIAALFALGVCTRFIPVKLYPLMIFAISIALVFHFSLISQHLIGSDSSGEYYVFKLTENSGHWRTIEGSIYQGMADAAYSSCLSVTILPAIYSALMNLNGEILFKVYYPFVFSLVPVVLYRIYEKQTSKLTALLSALLFISGVVVFYGCESLSTSRQIVAEFFLVLSIFLLLDKSIPNKKRKLLLIIFGVALIVSHYTIAYFFLFFIFFIFIVMKIKGNQDEVLDGKMVVLFFIITFSWQIETDISRLISLSSIFSEIFLRFFTDMFSPAARASDIFTSHPVLTVASVINWAFFYAVHSLIALGILKLIFKPGKLGLDLKFRVIATLSAVIILLCVVVPNLAPSLNFDRFYAITFLFLAPCFVLGYETFLSLSKSVWKKVTGKRCYRNAHVQIGTLIVCMILIGYFLSQSGFINKVTGAAPLSIPLDLDRIINGNSSKIGLYDSYRPDEEYVSVTWLLRNAGSETKVYADHVSVVRLLHDYGLIPYENLYLLLNSTTLDKNAYIYLRGLNVVDQVIAARSPLEAYDFTEVLPLLNESDQIYSNGISEIYWCP